MTARNAPSSAPATPDLVNEMTILDDAFNALQNGIRGYETAAEEVDDASLATTFRQLAASRREAYENLITVAAAQARRVPDDDSGSVPGALHRGWMKLKAVVAGDQAIVDSAVTGEDEAVADLERVLTTDHPAEVEEMVRRALLDVQHARQRLEAIDLT